MTASDKAIRAIRDSLYIEPISSCNLHCRMCYTNVVNGPNRQITEAGRVIDFVQRVLATQTSQLWVYWCGTGEVFLHRDFPQMVNGLLADYPEEVLTQTIQTNGTVRRLKEFSSLERLDFNVSIDGSREFHEWHRGKNTYDRTLDFCREAFDLGCRSVLVRMLLTRGSIQYLDEFKAELVERIGPRVKLAIGVPYTNRELRGVRRRAQAINQLDIEDETAISRPEALQILEEKYQNRYELDEDPDAVENYLSLTTYGVFSCCHGIIKLGEPEADVSSLWDGVLASERQCRSCAMFPCM
jgi:sulfatase maturation enzyme AslB (radical SAM superfamily)